MKRSERLRRQARQEAFYAVVTLFTTIGLGSFLWGWSLEPDGLNGAVAVIAAVVCLAGARLLLMFFHDALRLSRQAQAEKLHEALARPYREDDRWALTVGGAR